MPGVTRCGSTLPPALGVEPELAAPIRVQGAEQLLTLDHLPHRGHDRGCGMDLAGGIVQDHDQPVPALILKPLVWLPSMCSSIPGRAAARAAGCAHPVCAPWPLGRRPAKPASPRCSSARRRAPHITSRGSAAPSGRKIAPGKDPAPVPPAPPGSAFQVWRCIQRLRWSGRCANDSYRHMN